MPRPILVEIDPGDLRLPGGRRDGADPAKLQRQISQFGKKTEGMPRILVSRDRIGNLVINNGVTRASRVAKLLPLEKVIVEIIDQLPVDLSALPSVGERLP